jgi:hypothetical protein
MIDLLERYGGVATEEWAALHRLTERAKKFLEEAPDKRKAAQELLGAAAGGGDPEIVRLALQHVDWAGDDPRWFAVMEAPLRL